MAEKLSQLVDATGLAKLAQADQAKYEQAEDGTYKLVGDATPASEADPTLPAVLDEAGFKALPEAVQPFYETQEDGSFKLRGHEDVRALKNTVGHVRGERDILRDKLKAFEGFDADELKRLRAEQGKIEKEKELERSEFERQYAEVTEQYKTEAQLKEDRIVALERDLTEALIERQAALDISQAGGSAELLLPHVKNHTQMREIDGRNRAVVIGDDGKPRLKKGATKATDFLPIADYVEELKEDRRFAGAFSGSGASGGGATNSGGGVTSTGAPATVSKQDLKAIGKWSKSIAKGDTKVV
jgi:hypothetical protein